MLRLLCFFFFFFECRPKTLARINLKRQRKTTTRCLLILQEEARRQKETLLSGVVLMVMKLCMGFCSTTTHRDILYCVAFVFSGSGFRVEGFGLQTFNGSRFLCSKYIGVTSAAWAHRWQVCEPTRSADSRICERAG